MKKYIIEFFLVLIFGFIAVLFMFSNKVDDLNTRVDDLETVVTALEMTNLRFNEIAPVYKECLVRVMSPSRNFKPIERQLEAGRATTNETDNQKEQVEKQPIKEK